MIETPQIVQTKEAQTAVIPFTIPRAEMQQVFGPGVEELFGVLADQNVEPAGAVYAYHHRIQPDTFDFELGVPVGSPVAASGRVTPGRLPQATVARTVYQGPYEGLPDAWGAFDEWMRTNGHVGRQDLWESYVESPASNPDPSSWRTELNRPLAD